MNDTSQVFEIRPNHEADGLQTANEAMNERDIDTHLVASLNMTMSFVCVIMNRDPLGFHTLLCPSGSGKCMISVCNLKLVYSNTLPQPQSLCSLHLAFETSRLAYVP